jgi:hypothetical protein
LYEIKQVQQRKRYQESQTLQKMTYQEKFDELQKLFSEKFDVYEKFRKKLPPDGCESDELLKAQYEFEKANTDLQAYLILFKENNALPGDEFGSKGQRCST